MVLVLSLSLAMVIGPGPSQSSQQNFFSDIVIGLRATLSGKANLIREKVEILLKVGDQLILKRKVWGPQSC